MQTKQQIQKLLTSAGTSVSKRLGQHFLIDLNLMRLLIASANINSNDIVLEVGCGTGSLTQAIAEHAGKTIAVEFDRKLAEIAERQLTGKKNVQTINTDILENKNTINPTILCAIESARKKHSGKFLLVANLPYNTACPVILNLVAGPLVADAMYVTVQKEVASRMTATSGSKHYGTLSIFLTATGDVKTIRILKPTVFWPAPKVDSAMVSFIRDKRKASRIKNMELLSELVAFFMGHRRKTLIACTKLAHRKFVKANRFRSVSEINNWPEIFEQCSIDPHKRPEKLSPEDYIAVTNLCCEALNKI